MSFELLPYPCQNNDKRGELRRLPTEKDLFPLRPCHGMNVIFLPTTTCALDSRTFHTYTTYRASRLGSLTRCGETPSLKIRLYIPYLSSRVPCLSKIASSVIYVYGDHYLWCHERSLAFSEHTNLVSLPLPRIVPLSVHFICTSKFPFFDRYSVGTPFDTGERRTLRELDVCVLYSSWIHQERSSHRGEGH